MSERNSNYSREDRDPDRVFKRKRFNYLEEEEEERKQYITKVEKDENVKFKSYDLKLVK